MAIPSHPPGGLATIFLHSHVLCPFPLSSFPPPLSLPFYNMRPPLPPPFQSSPLLFRFFFSFILVFFELGLNYLLSHALHPAFFACFYCFLLFTFLSSLLISRDIPSSPHHVLGSAVTDSKLDIKSTSLSHFLSPTGMPDPHQGHVLCSRP